MVYLLLKAVHVLCVVLWVGGMAFAHFCLRPAVVALEPPVRLRLLHAVLQRFFTIVLGTTALIVVSGLWMIGRTAKQVVQSGGSFVWPLDWLLMTVVGLLMVALFGHIRFVLFKRLQRAVAASDWPSAGVAMAAIRRWVGVNLALGLALIPAVYLL